MTNQESKLVIGALLHDIGKVIFQQQGNDKRNHSQAGYEYLKDEAGIKEKEILDAVQFHHLETESGKEMKISNHNFAYLIYMANKIASATDNRKNRNATVVQGKSDKLVAPLQSVFNRLNGNEEHLYYEPKKLNPKEDINYPQEKQTYFNEKFYQELRVQLNEKLKNLEWSREYIHTLLTFLEEYFSYLPASTAEEEADISLYDHVKMTAAIATCIYQYLQEQQITDYQMTFLKESNSDSSVKRNQNNKNDISKRENQGFYAKKVFYLYTMDISGIQDFIYTIATKNALRTLRARSFYLEIVMEHIVDSLLERLNLSRANLIYSGGGHCYILMANTEKTRTIVNEYLQETNQWFLEQYQTALYIAGCGVACSSMDLRNEPRGSYSELFRTISAGLSKQKSARYCATDIIYLNSMKKEDYARECKVCKKIGKTDEEGVCSSCKNMELFSQKILYHDFFTVLKENKNEHREQGLPLPNHCILVSDDEASLKKRKEKSVSYVRSYAKNKMGSEAQTATKLWVGDYTTGSSMDEFAEGAKGITKIGVLRADVDNLGTAFVSGFQSEKNEDTYVTLSRTASLSRQLSLFFKLHMNYILEQPKYRVTEDGKEKRLAAIVYSGGDDVFIVGAWNEIIELAVDIRKELKKYTQGTLTISAGIGIYEPSYPIHAIAEEVAELEDKSKNLPQKNAVTLLEDGKTHMMFHDSEQREISDGTYSWDEFEEKVIKEKYETIKTYLDSVKEKGNSFLYRLLELIRNQEERINFARYVYLLSRVEPDQAEAANKAEYQERKEAYQIFSKKMYEWVKSKEDCRQLKTAITLYVYLNRKIDEES